MSFVVPSISAPGIIGGALYSNLIATVARWLNRTDLDDIIPDFVRIAESEMNADPRIADAAQVITTVGNISGSQITVPDDVEELHQVSVNGHPCEQLALADFQRTLSPYVCTRVGNVLKLPGNTLGSYELIYAQRLKPLRLLDDTNWLLQRYPDVYLWKCCEQGGVWLQDSEAAQGYRAKYEAAVANIPSAHNYNKWGGALQVQSPGVV